MKRGLFLLIGFASILLFAISVLLYRHGQVTTEPVTSEVQEISIASVAQHNSVDSCWLVYGQKVFSVSRLIESQPAQADQLKVACGTVLQTPTSGEAAVTLTRQLEPYYVGVIAP